jgi:hypothetical protein
LPEGLPEEALAYGAQISESDLVSFWQQNDTLAEALIEAFSAWYGEQWDAYHESRGADASEDVLARMSETQRDAYYERRNQAWERFVERNRITTPELARRVKELYGDRWAPDEIKTALGKIEMPTTFEAWMQGKTPEEREAYEADRKLSDAKELFWEAYWRLPEDADWRSTKGQPLVALIVDRDTRSFATAAQYEAAAAVLRQYIEEYGEGGEEEPTGGGGGGGGTYYRRSYGGGGGGWGGGGGRAQPRQLESWDTARRGMSSALVRQLSDFFLRAKALGAGALRELQALMEAMGWTGSLEDFLERLRELFKARAAPTGAPPGRYRYRR